MVVSHDRIFLDAVCTDMAVMELKDCPIMWETILNFNVKYRKRQLAMLKFWTHPKDSAAKLWPLFKSNKITKSPLTLINRDNMTINYIAGGGNISQVVTPSD